VRKLDEVLWTSVGVGAGITAAIAGRATPGRRRISRKQAASMAPVFPAETTASALPSPTARHAATSELSGFARTASAGFSCIPITCAVSTSVRPPVSSPAGPKRTGWMPDVAASSAPATISSGARSPPIASTATLVIAPRRRLRCRPQGVRLGRATV
jgi:hypothetical protein